VKALYDSVSSFARSLVWLGPHRPGLLEEETRQAYLYYYVARHRVYLDMIPWELQLLYQLIPQGPRIPYDLLHHGLLP
jgi:hypothetical protein